MRVWLPKVRRQFLEGFKGVAYSQCRVVTLTAPGSADLPDRAAIDAWNLDAAKRRHHFEVLLRRECSGAPLSFFWVGELQRRGAIHYHGIVRGVAFLDQGRVRELAVRAGFGRIAEVQGVREAAGAAGAWQYFSKYLFKSLRDWPYRSQVVTCSRDWSVVRRIRKPGAKVVPSPWALLPESAWWADEGRRIAMATLGAEDPEPVPSWVTEIERDPESQMGLDESTG